MPQGKGEMIGVKCGRQPGVCLANALKLVNRPTFEEALDETEGLNAF